MSWWLCTEYDQLSGSHGACLAVWVEASEPQDAADLAIPLLEEGREREGNTGDDGVPLENVYVINADTHTAYVVVPHAVLADLQCCGGMPGDPERHSALCPEASE